MDNKLPFTITGEISKEEAGLIVIIIMTTVGAISTAQKNYTIATAFTLMTLMALFVFIFIFLNKKYDYLSDKLPNLIQSELIYRQYPIELSRNMLISTYEQFYFRALKDKNHELAEAFKNKIEELKNSKLHEKQNK